MSAPCARNAAAICKLSSGVTPPGAQSLAEMRTERACVWASSHELYRILKREAKPVFEATAIFVLAVIAEGRNEAGNQISVPACSSTMSNSALSALMAARA